MSGGGLPSWMGQLGPGLARDMVRDQEQAKKDEQEAVNNLNNSIVKPPEAPTIDQESIKKARNTRLLELTQKSGRASTFLSGAGTTAKWGG